MDCSSNSSATPFSLSLPSSIMDGIKAMASGVTADIMSVIQKINDITTMQNVKSGIDSVNEGVATLKTDTDKAIADLTTLISWLGSNPQPTQPSQPYDKTSSEYQAWAAWLNLMFPILNQIIFDFIDLSSCIAGISATSQSYLTSVLGCNSLNDQTIADITSNLSIAKSYIDAQFNQILAIRHDFNNGIIFFTESDHTFQVLLQQLSDGDIGTETISTDSSATVNVLFNTPVSALLPMYAAITADLTSTSKVVDANTPKIDTTAASTGVSNVVAAASIPASPGLSTATTTAALTTTGGMSSVVAALKKPTDYPAIALYGNTPDSGLTYAGSDPIVWNRVNNERLRRNLPSLTDLGTPLPPSQ